MHVCKYVCICDFMYLNVYGFIPFPVIHVQNYYSYESILLHVPIGRRSHGDGDVAAVERILSARPDLINYQDRVGRAME